MNISKENLFLLRHAMNTNMKTEEILIAKFNGKIFLQKISDFDIYLNFLKPTLEILIDQNDFKTIDILRNDYLTKFPSKNMIVFEKVIKIIQINNLRHIIESLYKTKSYSSIKLLRDDFKEDTNFFDRLLKEIRLDLFSKKIPPSLLVKYN